MLPWVVEHILTLIVVSPVVGILVLFIVPRREESASSEIALASSGLTTFLVLISFLFFDSGGRFSFAEQYSWLPSLDIAYRVGVDGLGTILLLIVAVSTLFLVLIIWKRVRGFSKEVYLSLFAFEVGLLGSVVSTDLFMIYIFLEISVVSFGLFYLLNRGQGSVSRYVGFISFSSVLLMVVVIFFLQAAASGDLLAIEKVDLSRSVQVWVLLLLLAGVFCRMGIFPFHGWVRSVASISIGDNFIPLGLIFVTSGYFFYRLLPSVSYAASEYQPVIVWATALSIFFASMIAVSQKSLRDLFVYLFMVHFSFVVLGLVSLTPQGFAGASFQMVATMISISAISVIFTLLGRRGVKIDGDKFEGIFSETPIFGLFFFIIVLAVAGMPALSHFPGLFMIWMGLFKSSWVLAVFAIVSVVLLGVALVKAASYALYRPEPLKKEKKPGLPEVFLLLPFVLLVLVVGIFPDTILRYIKLSTEALWQIFFQ